MMPKGTPAPLGARWLASAVRAGPVLDERADGFAREVAELAGTLAHTLGEGARTGIYAAMGDAGMIQASALWADAQKQGPAFANPSAFPWSLASSVAAKVAVTLKAQGPNITFSGGANAAFLALSTAVEHLETGRVDRAVVIAADAGGGPEPWPSPAIVVVVLGPGTGSGKAQLRAAHRTGQRADTSCSHWLLTLCRFVENGEVTVVGSELNGWLEVQPTPPFPGPAPEQAPSSPASSHTLKDIHT